MRRPSPREPLEVVVVGRTLPILREPGLLRLGLRRRARPSPAFDTSDAIGRGTLAAITGHFYLLREIDQRLVVGRVARPRARRPSGTPPRRCVPVQIVRRASPARRARTSRARRSTLFCRRASPSSIASSSRCVFGSSCCSPTKTTCCFASSASITSKSTNAFALRVEHALRDVALRGTADDSREDRQRRARP